VDERDARIAALEAELAVYQELVVEVEAQGAFFVPALLLGSTRI
jgi:hypothetical protein